MSTERENLLGLEFKSKATEESRLTGELIEAIGASGARVGFDLSKGEDMTVASIVVPIPGSSDMFVVSHSWPPGEFVGKSTALQMLVLEAMRAGQAIITDAWSEMSLKLSSWLAVALKALSEEYQRIVAVERRRMLWTAKLWLVRQLATPKERHYIEHARKARVRKKYINRVHRRATRGTKK